MASPILRYTQLTNQSQGLLSTQSLSHGNTQHYSTRGRNSLGAHKREGGKTRARRLQESSKHRNWKIYTEKRFGGDSPRVRCLPMLHESQTICHRLTVCVVSALISLASVLIGFFTFTYCCDHPFLCLSSLVKFIVSRGEIICPLFTYWYQSWTVVYWTIYLIHWKEVMVGWDGVWGRQRWGWYKMVCKESRNGDGLRGFVSKREIIWLVRLHL